MITVISSNKDYYLQNQFVFFYQSRHYSQQIYKIIFPIQFSIKMHLDIDADLIYRLLELLCDGV